MIRFKSWLTEMAKRATPEQFYDALKAKYGAAKVKSLRWEDVVAVSREKELLIPPYIRSQKIGRGLFNGVPPDHVDSKTSAPKASPEAVKDTVSRMVGDVLKQTGGNKRGALSAVKAAMKSASQSRWETWGEIEDGSGGSLEFSVRDWGKWIGDDGSGDYDFQELAKESSKKMHDIITTVQNQHKDVKLDWQTGEKNWIYVSAR